MLVIGITGTLGAGKGTIVDYLIKNKNFKHYSVRKYLTNEIIKRKLQINRDNMVTVANDLRSKNSSSYIVEELYKKALKTNKNCIIESIRTVGEVNALKKKGNFFLFAVDADPKIRYKRVVERASETDEITFEKFINDEKKEMKSNDPNKQNLSKCIKMSDYLFNNDGKVEELYEKIKKTINKIQ